jgi:hypothetical protein
MNSPVGQPSSAELARNALLAAGLSVMAFAVFYGPDILTGSALFFTHDVVGSDLWHLNYPMKHYYQAALRDGRLPLWCPELGTGFPLHAEGQIAALYPFNLLLYAVLPLPLAFNWSIALTTAMAAAFTAMFARQIGAGRAGSLLAALVFAFSGFFITHLKHINMTMVAAWTPLLLFLLERHARRRSMKTLVAFAATTACMILAGHPHILYNNLLMAGLYGLVPLTRVWRRRPAEGGGRAHALRFGGGIVYASFIGVLLGAPQLLPTQELNRFGPRKGGMSIEVATEWEYHPKHLLAFLWPGAFGDPGELTRERVHQPGTRGAGTRGSRIEDNEVGDAFTLKGFEHGSRRRALFWEITGYVGLITLALAAIGAWLGIRTIEVRLLLALLVLSLLLALGRYGGLFYLFYHAVPGFDRFRFHDRFILYAGLFLAVLAGFGLTRLIERLPAHRRVLGGWSLAAVAALIWFADVFHALGDHNPKVDTPRWTTPPPSVVRIRREEAGQPTPFRILECDHSRSVFSNAYYRALGWKGDLSPYDPARNVLHSNLNLLFGIPNIRIYYQILPRWMFELEQLLFKRRAGRVAGVNLKTASLFNVRYVLDVNGWFEEELPLLDTYPGDVLIRRKRFKNPALRGVEAYVEAEPYSIRLHRNPRALPRAFLVSSARVVIDMPMAGGRGSRPKAALMNPDFDPRREVLIIAGRGEQVPIAGEVPGDPIEAPVLFDAYEPHRIRLRVNAPSDGWLFLSDTWYPGWSASVDGREAPVFRANVAGRAIRIPAGEHRVEFRYRPVSFVLGCLLAAGGLLLLMTVPLQGRLVRKLVRR